MIPVPWMYTRAWRAGHAAVTNLARGAETALKIDALQNAAGLLRALAKRKRAMNNSLRGNLRFNQLAVSSTL